MQDTDNLNDNQNDRQNDNSNITSNRFIDSIDEDIKINGFKKWLIYLKYYMQHKNEMDKEDLEDTREHIVYNYKKEEGCNISPPR